MSVTEFSCAHCGVYACKSEKNQNYPKFCLTTQDVEGKPIAEEIKKIQEHLKEDNEDSRIYHASAETEGLFFGQYTRVEEVLEFARRMGYHKIGIATCHGLIRETKIFTKILDAKGFDYYVAGCKVGSLDKTEIGIPDEIKINPGGFEATCNPILQAKILNSHKTDMNVIMGLCVGHDSLFIKYSDAIVTTLITKDRVMGHSPALALYTAEEYRPYLLEADKAE
ncbi:DUF1847 domain-containing protein [Hominifimenecus sp. rT4P-3]|uniref:DUF1847 domain-containing protein n=1 Tax=Hominifimenecus sp. rT4P-3 TaxID=3242979 RepID=UPI003DA3F98B